MPRAVLAAAAAVALLIAAPSARPAFPHDPPNDAEYAKAEKNCLPSAGIRRLLDTAGRLAGESGWL